MIRDEVEQSTDFLFVMFDEAEFSDEANSFLKLREK